MARIIGGQGCDRTNDFVLSLLHIRAAFLLVAWLATEMCLIVMLGKTGCRL